LEVRQHDAFLPLIFSVLVLVADLADLVGLEEQDLAEAFVGVDARGQRRGVGDLEGDEAFPLRLKRRDVDDDAAARVGRLADADGQHVARNLEVLHRARQGKRVGRHDADIGLHGDEGALVELLGIDDGAVDVGEDLELVGDAQVVSVGLESRRR
jgi:hypothetical protein